MNTMWRKMKKGMKIFGGIYMYPLEKLIEHPFLKTVGAAIIALFNTPVELAALIVLLWTVDFIVGSFVSKYRRKEEFDIYLVFLSFVKISGHIIFVMCFTWFANAFDMPVVQKWAFGAVAITELGSITRHIWGDKSKKVMDSFRKIMNRKLDTLGDVLDLSDDDLGNSKQNANKMKHDPIQDFHGDREGPEELQR